MTTHGHIDDLLFIDPLARAFAASAKKIAPANSSMFVRGWAFFREPARAAASINATIDGRIAFALACNQTRPDVAKALEVPAPLLIGFHGVGSLSDIACGVHELRIVLVDDETERAVAIDAHATFEIIDGATMFPPARRLRNEQLSIDVDVPQLPTAGKTSFVVRGWAIDRRFATGASEVYACIDGTSFARGVIGTARKDVSEAVGLPSVARCGFAVCIDTKTLEAGQHFFEIRAISADGEGYVDSSPHAFVVA